MSYTDGRAGSFQRSSDGRVWREFHGWGHIDEDGDFVAEENAPYHSHAKHHTPNSDGQVTKYAHRHEGHYKDDWCDDDDCDDRYGSYGRYGMPRRSGSSMNRGLGGSAEGYQDDYRRGPGH